MFLVESLNDKLRRTMYEIDPDKSGGCLFPYQKPAQNSAVFTTHKHDPQREFDSQKLGKLTKKDWEKTFTLPKLRKKWREKIKVNFNPNHKKIPDSLIPKETKEAKEFVKDLIDQDVLEIKNKRWNASVNPQMSNHRDVKKNLFEVSQGLNNFQVVPLKEKFIEEGVDSRNYLFIDGERWNNSNLFEQWEKKDIEKINLDKAKSNTLKYWRTNETDRINEEPFKISENRKKLEPLRYFHRYMTPSQDTMFRYNTFQKVKEITKDERKKLGEIITHKYPSNTSEKIEFLINKEMYHTYRDIYNELTGKSKRSSTSENFKKNRTDDDLSDKIYAINSWNDIGWFKPLRTEYNTSNSCDKDRAKRELLKLIVSKETKIAKEEEKIRDLKQEEEKKKQKLEELKKKDEKFREEQKSKQSEEEKIRDELRISKYGPTEYRIESERENKPETIDNQSKNNIIPISEPFNVENYRQAYMKVTLEDLKEKRKKMRNDKWIEMQYVHLGTFREFEFKSKKKYDPEIGKYKQDIENFKAWSCCMNTDENSRGCRKIRINKLKWNLDNA